MKCDESVASWGRHSMSFLILVFPYRDGKIKKGKWRQQKAIKNSIFYFNVFLNEQCFFQDIKFQRIGHVKDVLAILIVLQVSSVRWLGIP